MSRNAVAAIAAGQSQSSIIDLADKDQLIAIEVPTGWTAASITFLGDIQNDGTFLPIYDEAGTELTIASANVVAGRYLVLSAAVFSKLAGKIKLRSGTAALPVNQASAMNIPFNIGQRFS